MDSPSLRRELHFQALGGLERINRWGGGARILWPPIQALLREDEKRSFRVLDIATGGGDIPIFLWRRARSRGLDLEIDGCDKSLRAVEYASERAKEKKANIHFFQHNALARGVPLGYDIIISSLFLHHLAGDEAVRLLRRMAEAAKEMVLVNDLVRSVSSLVLTYLGTRLLSASEVVRTDGPRSVRAAFTIEEVQRMVQQAGLGRAKVDSRWPCRFLLTWKRAGGKQNGC